jgi:hypothetical protein
MFHVVFGDCGRPRMPASLPAGETGLLEAWISEIPDSYSDQIGASLGLPEDRSPAFRAKAGCHGRTAVSSTRIAFGSSPSGLDLLARIECLNAESASRPALAFEAMAHRDADRFASNLKLELSATACGFAIRHVDHLSWSLAMWMGGAATIGI